MRNTSKLRGLIVGFTVSGLILATGLQADGRIEINQASIEAAGGFPYTITEPGSYVLTGNLTVPAETSGIVIATSYVTIDLNGFSITGPASCTPSECKSGSGFGIVPENFLVHATRSTVRNGIVRGFSGICVLLTSGARIENLMVSECGLIGISAGIGVVTGNRVNNTGQAGLSMAADTAFAHNHVANAGLGGGGERAVEGGRASGGNSCEDQSCSPNGQRRFYLTDQVFTGAQAGSACASGFRIAAFYELYDLAALYYVPDLGFDVTEPGPPAQNSGWVYGGIGWNEGVSGVTSCQGYTSDQGGGDRAFLGHPFVAGPGNYHPWEFQDNISCGTPSRVWCIEQ